MINVNLLLCSLGQGPIRSHFPPALFGLVRCLLQVCFLRAGLLSYPLWYLPCVATVQALCNQLTIADSKHRQVFSWKIIISSQMSPLLGPVFGDFQAFSVWDDDMYLHLSLSVLV